VRYRPATEFAQPVQCDVRISVEESLSVVAVIEY